MLVTSLNPVSFQILKSVFKSVFTYKWSYTYAKFSNPLSPFTRKSDMTMLQQLPRKLTKKDLHWRCKHKKLFILLHPEFKHTWKVIKLQEMYQYVSSIYFGFFFGYSRAEHKSMTLNMSLSVSVCEIWEFINLIVQEAALKLGVLTAEEFDTLVVPEKMIGPSDWYVLLFFWAKVSLTSNKW